MVLVEADPGVPRIRIKGSRCGCVVGFRRSAGRRVTVRVGSPPLAAPACGCLGAFVVRDCVCTLRLIYKDVARLWCVACVSYLCGDIWI